MRFKKIHCLVWAIGCWYLSTVSSFILPVRRSKVAFPQCQSDLRPYRTTFLIRDTCYFQNQCKKAIRTRQFPAVYSVGDDFVEAEDLEALQSLFRKYCDSDGLMTSQSVQNVPSIAQLLADGDLLIEEFNDIWDKAPKFPDPETAEERIDVDSFVQIYRDVDDLFEVEDEEVEVAAKVDRTLSAKATSSTVSPSLPIKSATNSSVEDGSDEDDGTMEAELESIFETICTKDKLVSKQAIKEWDEVSTLLNDGLLGEEEFEELWQKTKKSPGSPDMLDVDGFLSFSVALDGLFDFDDEDMADEDDDFDDEYFSESSVVSTLVEGDEMTADELFDALAGEMGQIDKAQLMRWAELDEMLRGGDILKSEFESIYEKAATGRDALDRSGFKRLYSMIDELFEEIDDELGNGAENEVDPLSAAKSLKSELLDSLADMEDPNLLPCGLDATEREQQRILDLVTKLEQQPTNLVIARQGAIGMKDLVGTWDLLYTSSSAVKFNKGLSGLGGSFPNGRFGGLKQTLKATKFTSDVEYKERIEVTPSTASFDVTVTGDWELSTSVSLFTGQPSIVMRVEPGLVTYGPTSMRGDHWKSLGPTNMLDISYLDDDLRIMRGNTAVETVFIFRRTSQ